MSASLANADLPKSHWHATFPPPVPSDELPATAEGVVVGGGLVGCWTAYWLAKRGIRATVIEQEVISWGATGRNGGFLIGGAAMGYATAVATLGKETAIGLWHLTDSGRDLAIETIAAEGIVCDFRQPGTMALALTADDLAGMRRNQALMQEDGFAAQILDRATTQAMIGTPLAEEIAGAYFDPKGGLLHSGRYLAGIAAAAHRNGARFCRATVTGVASDANGVIVTTTAGIIQAGRVMVATNAWSDTIIPDIAGKIVPVRGQILAYEAIAPVFSTAIAADITSTEEYWQQTPDGSIVIGGCRTDAPGADVGVREMAPTPDVTAKIESVLPRLFPELGELTVARRWAGLMAFTADSLPVADAVPSLPNVWMAGGFCGHGMPYGPILGKLMAETIATGEKPAALDPLRLDRPSLAAVQATSEHNATLQNSSHR